MASCAWAALPAASRSAGGLQVREGAFGEVVLDGVEQALPAAQAFDGLGFVAAEAARRLDVLRRLAGVLHGERGVHHAEEARPDALGGAADADEAGQRQVLGGQQRGGHGADGRVLHDRAGLPAGVHQGRAALVAAFVGHQRADDRQVLELAGDGRQDFADLDAGSGGLDGLELAAGLLAGLEIPQVHVAGSAAHPQDDEAFVVFLELGRGRLQALQEVACRGRPGPKPPPRA